MKELNYAPNSLAKSLSNQKAFTVALLVSIEDPKSFSNPFFYEIMHGIETIVYSKELCLIIANQKNASSGGSGDDIIDWLVREKRARGLILPSSIVHTAIVKKLKQTRFPFVVLGEPSNCREPVSWIDINNRQGSGQAVEHFLNCGYKKIALISGQQKNIFNKNRFAGYREALEENGMQYDPDYAKKDESTKENGVIMTRELLALPERPDAILCGDNILSIGAMKAIHETGLKVPHDIGLISFDNYPIADLVEPALTTVDIDVFELGVQAANMLFRLIENPEAREQQVMIGTRIKERNSTRVK
jgi:DNA-binding LacI/PurR family transcriptional regulator